MEKNKLIESFFYQKENMLSDNLIEGLIREQFKKIISEQEKTTGQMPLISKDFALKSIPNIEIDELFWADMSANPRPLPFDEDEKWMYKNRGMLSSYLKNIGGNTLEEKIKNIENFYNVKTKQDLAKFGFKASTNGEYVSFLMSYLVFIKTLTKILSQINSSSAGFAFEAFLAVLLNGKQLADNTRITDIEAEEKGKPLYLSCKLLGKSTTSASGSIKNLQKELSDGKIIYYVIAIKNLEPRKPLESEGTITFYKVPLSMDDLYNFFKVAGNSVTQDNFRILKRYVETYGKEIPSVEKIPKRLKIKNTIEPDGPIRKVAEEKESTEAEEELSNFATFEESLAFFNSLSLEEKSKAVQQSRGYLLAEQFVMLRNNIPKEKLINFANITIGKTAIAEIVNTFKNEIFRNTLSVIANLASANQLFNEYLAEGMKDNSKAEQSKKHIKESETNIDSIMEKK
jgi:hypothetical protein